LPEERRTGNSINLNNAYKRFDIDKLIYKERRSTNKSKLLEIKQQQKAWFTTVFICLLVNLSFLFLAYLGWTNATI
jgi:hypothetical protein